MENAKANTIWGAVGSAISAQNQARPLVATPHGSRVPMSFAQQRLWFVCSANPDSPAYNVPFAWRLTGRIEIKALEQSFNALIERHEILRTNFKLQDGVPLQIISPGRTVQIVNVDLMEESVEAELQRRMTAEARIPFDLAEGPLLRVTLFRKSATEHVLLLTLHHIIFDGWSLGLLYRELSSYYKGFTGAPAAALPELKIQYADFALWHQDWLQGPALEQQLSFWKEHLKDAPQVLELPGDRIRPAQLSPNGACHYFELSPELSSSIDTLRRKESSTLYPVLLAAFYVLLHRYTGQDDIVVGATVGNRNQFATRSLMGFFVNMLVLRNKFSQNLTFRGLLRNIMDLTAASLANQDLPFERLVEELRPNRGVSQTPLFQVGFNFQTMPRKGFDLPGLQAEELDANTQTSKFDLTLDVRDEPDGIRGFFEYSTDLFSASFIKRMASHFQTILTHALSDPDQSIQSLNILPEEERRRLLVEFNATKAEYPKDKTVVDLFEEQVETTPENVAIVFGETKLSYRELNARANAIAHYLREKHSIQPDDRVGVLLGRSEFLPVALLGILKAGGAYVPIDPEYPQERIRFILEDAGCRAVVTEQAFAAQIPSGMIALDVRDLPTTPVTNLARSATQQHLAYVIYTSGSTGKPKGCQLEHHNLTHYLTWALKHYFGARDHGIFGLYSSISFDLTITSVFTPLLQGKLLWIYPNDLEVAQVLQHSFDPATPIDAVKITPSHIALLDHLNLKSTNVRTAIVGGEALTLAHVNILRRLNPEMAIYNEYGPTETTVGCIVKQILPAETHVLIGRPISNTRIYVLDASMQPVPVGVSGEFFIGGAGVARGYLNRPELTAEKYVADPFTPGERLYRTGDVGRWLDDGNLEFFGRNDDQVKLRGFRVELGEIESRLAEHPAINQACVIARDDAAGGKFLAAYVVPVLNGEFEGSTEAEKQVEQWQETYDYTYGTPVIDDVENDFTGWTSSYTRDPIPLPDMEEWRQATVDEIRALKPARILEIGCGSGLLLFALAPTCERYVGLDFSRVVVERLKHRLDPDKHKHVTVMQRTADDLSGIEPRSFDVVIINSVIQYFPNLDYLEKVLKGAVEAAAPGGCVCVGDVRNLALLEMMQAEVAVHQAAADMPAARLRSHVWANTIFEPELLLDPAIAAVLPKRLPRVSHVQVRLKRGHSHNELSRYRYTLLLHVDQNSEPVEVRRWLDWRGENLTLDRLREELWAHRDSTLGVTGIENARLGGGAGALAAVSGLQDSVTAGALRSATGTSGLDPEAVWELADKLGLEAELAWSRTGPAGSYDAVFMPKSPGKRHPVALPIAKTDAGSRAWDKCANNPVRSLALRNLTPKLRTHLLERLPEHMVPAHFVWLEKFPLTTNGKVDKKALPSIEGAELASGVLYVAPRNEIEQKLAAIWSEVLGHPKVGIHDNFFDLGGHSLRMMQVVSRIHRDLGVEIGLLEMFQAVTIAQIAEAVAQKSPTLFKPIARTPQAADYPLSHAQQRLWLLSKLDTGSVAYNMPMAMLFDGPLDGAALEAALQTILERHESLRTRFFTVNGEPRQAIDPAAEFKLRIQELGSGPEAEQRALEIARQDAAKPFDLEHGPLFRAQLLRFTPTRHVYLANMHHIVGDGWSTNVLLRELKNLYMDYARGQRPQPKPLSIQYKDYAAWQNELLRSDAMEAHKRYWLEKLSGELPVLDLPSDFPRPAEKSFAGEHLNFMLDAATLDGLQRLSLDQGASLFMTLVALTKVLLHRYTGLSDIIVGSPIAGRNHPDLENQIGFYVNTVALRDCLNGSESFAQLLRKVKQTATEAYEHEIYPFDQLVNELSIQRDMSRSPIFNVLAVLQNQDQPVFKLSDVKGKPLAIPFQISKFDMTLNFTETEEGTLKVGVEFCTALFKWERMERMTQHFRELVRSVLADCSQPIQNLNILPEKERLRVVAEFNATETPQQKDKTIIDLFEEQAEATPDAVAVVYERTKLTYRELNTRANAVAHHLRTQHQIRGDDRVGVLLHRSEWLPVALLGIMKAGGAYVPIDPEYPQERIWFALRDADCKAVLTEKDIAKKAARDQQPPFLDIRKLRGEASNPPRAAKSQNLAYIIYTSGSTGQPKGVMIEHRSVVNLVRGLQQHVYARHPGKLKVAVIAAFVFDGSVKQIFAALLQGHALHIVSDSTKRDGALLNEYLCEQQIDVTDCTPTLLSLMVQSKGFSDVKAGLKHVLVGGEALLSGVAEATLAAPCSMAVTNVYGPTECCVDSTAAALDAASCVRTPVAPIGRPLNNTQVYIVDACMQPVPIGISGEIYIGGAGVARGYLKRDDLTRQKFLANPFRAGERVYRSGDVGRWSSDGNIEFLGRNDEQVKVRGFRIELGEIETRLAEHRSVRQACVAAREMHGTNELVAYIVSDEDVNVVSLREHLSALLPAFMVPSHFVRVEKFPLTASGKIDRKALPSPEGSQLASGVEYVAPRNEIEQKLAAIWSDVLGREKIGVADNFFDLGGHSLLAVRLLAAIEKEWGRKLPLRIVFHAPTIERMAKVMEKDGWRASSFALVTIHGEGSRPPLFCISAPGGGIPYYNALSHYLGTDQPVYAFHPLDRRTSMEAESDKPEAPLETRLADTAQIYIKEMRSILPNGPFYLCGHSRGGTMAYIIALELREMGLPVKLLALFDTNFYGFKRKLPFVTTAMLQLRALLKMSWADKAERMERILGRIRFKVSDLKEALTPNSWLSQEQVYERMVREEGRKDGAAIHNHKPRPYYGYTTLFRCTEQSPWLKDDLTLGWQPYAAGGIEVIPIPGHHGNLVMEPGVRTLAVKLRQCMDKLISEEKVHSLNQIEAACAGG